MTDGTAVKERRYPHGFTRHRVRSVMPDKDAVSSFCGETFHPADDRVGDEEEVSDCKTCFRQAEVPT